MEPSKNEIFLSWSGETSGKLAMKFKETLEEFFPETETFHSSQDIPQGAEWKKDLDRKLQTGNIGIFFLVDGNTNSPWLMFEAGALMNTSAVMLPILFKVSHEIVKGPILHYNTTIFEKNSFKKLFNKLNDELGNPLNKEELSSKFKENWVKLKGKIDKILFQHEFGKTFKDLEIKDQIFVFIDGIVRKQNCTFYKPRKDEIPLNILLSKMVATILNDEINNDIRSEFLVYVDKWLRSKNPQLIFFASEVIGYFRFDESKEMITKLETRFKDMDEDVKWQDCYLNCLWAYSRLTSFSKMNKMLIDFKNEDNVRWILQAYEQKAKHPQNIGHMPASEFIPTLKAMNYNALKGDAKKSFDEIFKLGKR